MFKPYVERKDNMMEMMNEYSIFLLLVIPYSCLLTYDSFLEASGRQNLGILLITILTGTLAINYLVFMYHIIRDLSLRLKRICIRRKMQRLM